MREMRNADCGIAARLSPLSSCTAWFQALLAICNSAIRISSRLSPVATALDLGLVSSSFGNFAIRIPQSAFPPHFLSPFGRRHRSRSRLGFKLFRQFRNPQSAIRISSHPHRVCQRRPASKSCQAISPGIPKAISRTRRSSESASAISPEMPSRLPSRI